MQRPNQILYYDNTRENQYPVSDNLRNQLSSKDKYLKPINNINNNLIYEVNIHQNKNQQNYNIIQPNRENTLTNFNVIDTNNNIFQNNINQNQIDLKEEDGKSNTQTCCQKTCKIFWIILLIILLLPIAIFCIFIFAQGGASCPSDFHSSNSNSICDCCKCRKRRRK